MINFSQAQKKFFQYLNFYSFCYLSLILFFALLLCKPIDFTVQDIGRHLTNGREILSGNWKVLYSNHYSYTMPEAKFVNHHWLSGVFFFLIEQAAGLKTLHLFHILLYSTGLIFLLKIIKKHSNHFLTLTLGIAAALLLSARAEIRPETFGYVFICHSLWQLDKILSEKKIKWQQFLLLLVQQILWVNLHISFIFGIFVFSVPILVQFLKNEKKFSKQLVFLNINLTLISLVNPHFLLGLIQPLAIFHDYGYKIVENQNLWFLLKIINKSNLYYWFLLLLTFLLVTWKNFLFDEDLIFAITGLILGFIALRNLPLLAIFLLPYLGQKINQIANKLQCTNWQIEESTKKLFLLIIFSSILLISYPTRLKNKIKLGDFSEQHQAAEFFEKKQLKGPIFNNYDLGSYLIYHLYPHEKVFTDNRPEAYSKKFFEQTYIPMQENPKIWSEMSKKYNFQTIFFGTRDLTPWGQKFLYLIKQNPNWQLTYEDQFCLIMKNVNLKSDL